MAKKSVSFRLDEAIIELLEEHSKITGRKKTDLVEVCLKKVLENAESDIILQENLPLLTEKKNVNQDVLHIFNESIQEFRQLVEESRILIKEFRNTNNHPDEIQTTLQTPQKKKKTASLSTSRRGQKYKYKGVFLTLTEHLEPIKETFDEREFRNAYKNVLKKINKGKSPEEAIQRELEKRSLL